jgi:hypothetical protein
MYCVPLPPLRGQHMVLCHPRWLPTSGLTEFAICWGGAGFEPKTTDLQSGALPLSHHVVACDASPLSGHSVYYMPPQYYRVVHVQEGVPLSGGCSPVTEAHVSFAILCVSFII